MPTYVTPGVYFEAVDLDPPPVRLLPTDVAGFVGIAERGPLHHAIRLGSWQQFLSAFGGLAANGFLGYAVKAFFENGGRACYVVRVSSEDARTAGVDVVDGTAARVLRIDATSPGTWANRLDVRVDRRSPAATRAADPTVQPADGAFSVVTSVAGFRSGTIVSIDIPGTPAPPVLRVVVSIDAAEGVFVWDAPLPAALAGQELVLESIETSVSVYERGRLQELLTVALASHRPEDGPVLARGHLVEVRIHEDQGTLTASDFRLPSSVELDAVGAPAPAGRTRLAGGKDGLATLKAAHFTGRPGADEYEGLRALELVDEVSFVAAPDILVQPLPPVESRPEPSPEHDPCLPCAPPPPLPVPPVEPPDQPPIFSLRDVATVQHALVQHCEVLRDRVAILDGPADADLAEIQSWRARFDSKYAALYYPWVLVHEPRGVGLVRAIPPSGHVAGVYARTDLATGVHRAPANELLDWAVGLAAEVGPEAQGFLNPLGVNCLRSFNARGLRVYGARTVSSDPSWRFVNVRRLMSAIEEAVDEATQWAVFEPHTVLLRHAVTLAISGLLEELWSRGALFGEAAEDAFFVKCDDENNSADSVANGKLVADVGVAAVRPAEFVVFRIGRTENELEIIE